GRDPDEVGHGVVGQVAAELAVGDDAGGAARGVGADVVEVDPGVVLLHVGIRIAHETRRRHSFQIGLPGFAAGLDLVGQVTGRDVAGDAVAVDAEGAAGGERQVVGQARMADRVDLGAERVTGRQAVEVGGGAVADDVGDLL